MQIYLGNSPANYHLGLMISAKNLQNLILYSIMADEVPKLLFHIPKIIAVFRLLGDFGISCSAYIIPKYNIVTNKVMSHDKSEITISDKKRTIPLLYRPVDNMLESFRRDIQNAFLTLLWPRSLGWRFPSFGTELDTRTPPCDMVDKGDKYEVTLEVPGIPKEKIDIKTRKKGLRSLDSRKRPKRRGKIMYIMNSHTSHSAEVSQFQKKLFHQR